MTEEEEKPPSRGLALVKLDFLIRKKCRSNVGRKQKSGGTVPKSKKNKYLTSKSLFLKDLAVEPQLKY
jgi:hypothetical protein